MNGDDFINIVHLNNCRSSKPVSYKSHEMNSKSHDMDNDESRGTTCSQTEITGITFSESTKNSDVCGQECGTGIGTLPSSDVIEITTVFQQNSDLLLTKINEHSGKNQKGDVPDVNDSNSQVGNAQVLCMVNVSKSKTIYHRDCSFYTVLKKNQFCMNDAFKTIAFSSITKKLIRDLCKIICNEGTSPSFPRIYIEKPLNIKIPQKLLNHIGRQIIKCYMISMLPRNCSSMRRKESSTSHEDSKSSLKEVQKSVEMEPLPDKVNTKEEISLGNSKEHMSTEDINVQTPTPVLSPQISSEEKKENWIILNSDAHVQVIQDDAWVLVEKCNPDTTQNVLHLAPLSALDYGIRHANHYSDDPQQSASKETLLLLCHEDRTMEELHAMKSGRQEGSTLCIDNNLVSWVQCEEGATICERRNMQDSAR